jgi:hypothetical protein
LAPTRSKAGEKTGRRESTSKLIATAINRESCTRNVRSEGEESHGGGDFLCLAKPLGWNLGPTDILISCTGASANVRVRVDAG